MDMALIVKALLGTTKTDYDNIIDFHINHVKQMILNHCNLIDLPIELETTVVTIVYNHMKATVAEFNPVKSTSTGDTTVSFAVEPIKKEVLADLESELNQFRDLPE